ncbi:PadR family transcriptional regulator [Exiguobacterium qingdaonense]|uniref:PadR family transcriptional regulator n=1 Tax=Exiguobacterium qingdaonense TaxID=2751251 RepID=UPI001BE7AAFC|nr:PadR family transcriptional regulator [Exiguobacterium qingdaonense]
MNPQFKKGVLNLCVLALVAERDRYGYELVQAISAKVSISEGAVYPLLRRLTTEGYFTTYLTESGEGPPRKYYQITEQGRTHLTELRAEWNVFTTGVNDLIRGGEDR